MDQLFNNNNEKGYETEPVQNKSGINNIIQVISELRTVLLMCSFYRSSRLFTFHSSAWQLINGLTVFWNSGQAKEFLAWYAHWGFTQKVLCFLSVKILNLPKMNLQIKYLRWPEKFVSPILYGTQFIFPSQPVKNRDLVKSVSQVGCFLPVNPIGCGVESCFPDQISINLELSLFSNHVMHARNLIVGYVPTPSFILKLSGLCLGKDKWIGLLRYLQWTKSLQCKLLPRQSAFFFVSIKFMVQVSVDHILIKLIKTAYAISGEVCIGNLEWCIMGDSLTCPFDISWQIQRNEIENEAIYT